MTRRYTVLIEKGPTSYGAYVPDLPGCAAVAKSRREVVRLIAEAIPQHIKALEDDGTPVPPPAHEAIIVSATRRSPRPPQISPIRVIKEGQSS